MLMVGNLFIEPSQLFNLSIAIYLSRYAGQGGADKVLNVEILEQVARFKYLGMDIEAGRLMKTHVSHRLREGTRIWGTPRGVSRKRHLYMEEKWECLKILLYHLFCMSVIHGL